MSARLLAAAPTGPPSGITGRRFRRREEDFALHWHGLAGCRLLRACVTRSGDTKARALASAGYFRECRLSRRRRYRQFALPPCHYLWRPRRPPDFDIAILMISLPAARLILRVVMPASALYHVSASGAEDEPPPPTLSPFAAEAGCRIRPLSASGEPLHDDVAAVVPPAR